MTSRENAPCGLNSMDLGKVAHNKSICMEILRQISLITDSSFKRVVNSKL